MKMEGGVRDTVPSSDGPGRLARWGIGAVIATALAPVGTMLGTDPRWLLTLQCNEWFVSLLLLTNLGQVRRTFGVSGVWGVLLFAPAIAAFLRTPATGFALGGTAFIVLRLVPLVAHAFASFTLRRRSTHVPQRPAPE